MKLCPKAVEIQKVYGWVKSAPEVRDNPSKTMTTNTWIYTDRKAFVQAMNRHVKYCKMCVV